MRCFDNQKRINPSKHEFVFKLLAEPSHMSKNAS